MSTASSSRGDDNPSKFYFVPVDGLQNRRRKHASTESQKHLLEARRHVMRGISGSRQRRNQSRRLVGHVSNIPVPQSSKGLAEDPLDSRPRHDALSDVPETQEPARQGQAHRQNSSSNTAPVGPYEFDERFLGGGRLDPFRSWPVNLTKRMRYLLDYVLTTDCKSLVPFRSVSWPLLSLDTGIFYHTLAIAASCLSVRYHAARKEKLATEALIYYTMGLNSVNSRLGDKAQEQSDGIVVSIMGIAIHTLTRSTSHRWCWERALPSSRTSEGDVDQWIMHFRALKTIIDRRGGIESIDRNESLRFWFYLMDVEGAATRDVRPFFPLPVHILPSTQTLQSPRKPAVEVCLSVWTQELPAQRAIIDIFLDLDARVKWLSEQGVTHHGSLRARSDLDASYLVPLLHRCLQLSGRSALRLQAAEDEDSISCRRHDAFHEALRHAIILFLAPIRRYFGPPAGGTELHIMMLTSALELCLAHRAALDLGQLILWMVVVGGMEACSLGQDASWFFSRVVDCCTILGATRYEDVKRTVEHTMSQLIWLEEAMSSALALMMGELQAYMVAPDMTIRRD